MGKKNRKGRSVRNNPNVHKELDEVIQAPHSFVIHRGLPGKHVVELTKDFRKIMEPFTAAALKERKKNSIKDFVSIAGPLHVSHLVIVSQSELGMYLKISRLPRGPTLTFKIHNYSLARDVVSSLKRQVVIQDAFNHSPLMVMNSFSGEGMHMKLMASMFQNMFPTINLTNVDLNTIRRCVLVNYNPTTKLIDFRHYTIKVIPVGISKGVKKVVQGKIPNLAKCSDISEFLTKSGILSESEFEDDPTNHVTLAQPINTRGNMESGKSSIKLSELGPRLTLQLIKIEDGLLDGEVLYHTIVEKTDEEKLEIQKRREAKMKLKEKRKKIQNENKQKKESEKQELKEKSLKGMGKNKKDAEAEEQVEEEADDDAQYYREEVGEEPDKDLFTQSQSGGRPRFKFNKNLKPHADDKKRDSSSQNRPFKRKFENTDRNKDESPRKRFKKNSAPGKHGKKINKVGGNRDHRPIGGKSGNKPKHGVNKQKF